MASKDKNDDKIRVRCIGCGKRIKFPAGQPGTAFRCPICKTTIVTPLSGEEVDEAPALDLKLRSPATTPPRRRSPAPVQAAAPAQPPAPSAPPQPAIDRLNEFILREQRRQAELCRQVVRNGDLSEEKKTAELVALRHQKAVGIRSFVSAMLRDFEHRIEELRNCPSADTESGKKRIAAVEEELAGIRLYLKVMYQMRTVAQDDQRNGATHGTPATAAPPPSRVSPPDAQTSQS